MRRVFAVDVLVCGHCGGPRRVLDFIVEQEALRRILGHLGLATEPPWLNGVGAATMPTPPVGPLCGTILHTQSAVFEANTNQRVLTNTARVRI